MQALSTKLIFKPMYRSHIAVIEESHKNVGQQFAAKPQSHLFSTIYVNGVLRLRRHANNPYWVIFYLLSVIKLNKPLY